MPEFARDGAVIHYTDSGMPAGHPDAATVFFGHGLLFSGWLFHPQIAALRADYRCVAIDWRGQGSSGPSDRGYDMDTLADDAIALIDSLDVAPAHYAGLSMGGMIGQRIAARRPDLVRSLSLLDTSAGPEDPAKVGKYKLLGRIYRITGLGPLRGAVLPLMFGPKFLADQANKPVLDEWERQLKRSPRAGISSAVMCVANRHGVEAEIGRISAPTLVLAGADDAAIPPAKAQHIADAIPGARFHLIADCGHSSTLEQPEIVTAHLRDFLASVSQQPPTG